MDVSKYNKTDCDYEYEDMYSRVHSPNYEHVTYGKQRMWNMYINISSYK